MFTGPIIVRSNLQGGFGHNTDQNESESPKKSRLQMDGKLEGSKQQNNS